MRCLVVVLAATAPVFGCDEEGDGETAFAHALPDGALFRLDFPTSSRGVQAALSTERDPASNARPTGAVGEYPVFYDFSRRAARHIDASLKRLLAPIQQLVRDRRPARRSPRQALWRIAPRADDPDEHALLVLRRDDGHFEYSAWSREGAGRGGARWRFRLFGTTTPSDRGRGRGLLWANLDNDRDDRTRGKLLATWEELDGRRELSVSQYGAHAEDDAGGLESLSYLFVDGPEGGLMLYGPEEMDVFLDQNTSAPERLTLLTRWDHAGVGRSDVTVRGGDLRDTRLTAVIDTQCWRADDLGDFRATYLARHFIREGSATPIEKDSEGDRSACPAFELERAAPLQRFDEPDDPRTPPQGLDAP